MRKTKGRKGEGTKGRKKTPKRPKRRGSISPSPLPPFAPSSPSSSPPQRPPVAWSPAERLAWRYEEPALPSAWCESAPIHVPDNAINPEPGPYAYGRTPWWREVIDLLVDPWVREIWCLKSTQIGWSRLMMNFIGYCIDQDPGALGLLLPDEDTVDELFAEELVPTIDQTPTLRRHKSARAWDTTKQEIWLDTMPVFGLYAGSVQKLARRTLRYVIGDEIDKYRPFRKEASPIQLLLKRTSNWLHKARALFGSTPTTRDGNIAVGYEGCPDKRRFAIPCWRCGFYQVPLWSQVKGFREAPGETKFERANWVRLNEPCWYECEGCKKEITHQRKAQCVAAGVWISQEQTVRDGKPVGPRIKSAKVGLHLSSIVSPWLSFSALAAEFIEAEGDPDKTRDFRNARLALVVDEVVKTVRPSAVRDKKVLAPAPVRAGGPVAVPNWAVALLATADTQKDFFAVVIRAWGFGLRSQLIWHGEVQSFPELYEVTLAAKLPLDGEDGKEGRFTTPSHLLIDSGGDRTEEVYQFARRDPRIVPCKGASNPMRRPWSRSALPSGVELRIFDTNYFKDMLARLIGDPDPAKHLPHQEVSEQYCLEMGSEQKIADPKRRGHFTWVKTGATRNEAWDCEVLQCLGADMANVAVTAPPEPVLRTADKTERERVNPLDYRGRW